MPFLLARCYVVDGLLMIEQVSYLMIVILMAVATIGLAWLTVLLAVLSYWRVMLALLIPTLVNIAIKKVVGYCLVTAKSPELGDHVRMRYEFKLSLLTRLLSPVSGKIDGRAVG